MHCDIMITNALDYASWFSRPNVVCSYISGMNSILFLVPFL